MGGSITCGPGNIAPPSHNHNAVLNSQINSLNQGINWLEADSKHPTNGNDGDAYFNTADGKMYVYDGSNWLLVDTAFEEQPIYTVDVMASDNIYTLHIQGQLATLDPKDKSQLGEPLVTGAEEILEYLKDRINDTQLMWVEKAIFEHVL